MPAPAGQHRTSMARLGIELTSPRAAERFFRAATAGSTTAVTGP